jgi:hypothetical protein
MFTPRRYVLGSFATPHALLAAATRLRPLRLGRMDTHTPYPLHGVERALGLRRARIPLLVLCGALLGAVTGYGMIHYMNVIDWAINVGNRPPHSPPANVPVTFEMAILFGAGFAFCGLLILTGLPRPYHPVFQASLFRRSSVDRFVLSIELPPEADAGRASEELKALGADPIEAVEEWER